MPTACGGGFGGKLDVSVQPLLARRRVAARPAGAPASTTRAGEHGLLAPSATRRASRAVGCRCRGTLHRLRRSTAISTPAPTPPGGRRWPNRVPVHASGPYRGAQRARPRPRRLHQCHAVRRLPRLRRAAGGDRARGADGRPRRPGWASTAGSSAAATRCAPGDVTATGQVLRASAGLAAVPRCARSRTGTRCCAARCERSTQRRGTAPLRRGAGIGCMWYGCGNTALSNPSTMRIALARDGRLTLSTTARSTSARANTTVIGQICADALGLPMAALRQVVTGDTDADRGCRQDLGLAPDLRLGQGGRARRPRSAAKDICRGAVAPKANAQDRRSAWLWRATARDPRRTRITHRVIDLAALDADLGRRRGSIRRPRPLDARRPGRALRHLRLRRAGRLVEVDLALGTAR